jgi:hypothetical protein
LPGQDAYLSHRGKGAPQLSSQETYRLNKAILSIHSENPGSRVPIMVPSGAMVTISNGPLDGLRMVDVLWEEKTVMMFTVDLRDRATLIPAGRAKV